MPPHSRWAFVGDSARSDALAVLSPEERARLATTPDARAGTFLAGRLLLRTLVGGLTGTAPGLVALTATCPDCGGPHGRPVVAGSDLRVSLAHAGDLVVAAASWGAPVGIDVERSVLPPARLAAIGEVAGRASVQHWTRVEAVLKADGRGLRVDPALVVIDGEVGSAGRDRYLLIEPDLPEGYTGSMALRL